MKSDKINRAINEQLEQWLKENQPVHKVFRVPSELAKTAKDDVNKTGTSPGYGNKVTNPDTEEGRVNLIKQLALEIKDLQTRAQILNKQIDRAIGASNRQDFKEQLILMSDGLVALKGQIEKLNKVYLITVKNYEKERGRQAPVEVQESKKNNKK